jgi:two-component system osmolarity sensor histidine kinase EnvZ
MNTMSADIKEMTKQQEFLLAGMSHDLRTPLTRIRIATRVLGFDTSGFIEGINQDIAEMDLALNQFIALARFNVEQTEPWVMGDLNQLIKAVSKKYQRSEINLRLGLKIMPLVRFKPMALERYLYNIIDNSLKHGDGNITLSTTLKGNTIELCVSDNGPGFALSAEALASYSDLRVECSRGNGLGLRIVQQIAKLHEGKLTLRNKSEGGAEIILSLKANLDKVESS